MLEAAPPANQFLAHKGYDSDAVYEDLPSDPEQGRPQRH